MDVVAEKRAPVKRKYHIAMKKEQMNSEVLKNPGGNSEVRVQVAPVNDKRAQPPSSTYPVLTDFKVFVIHTPGTRKRVFTFRS